MSVVIRISYERPEELETILHKLAPLVEKAKIAKVRPGEYRRAYLTLKDTEPSDSGGVRFGKPTN